jgi:hypothetical protein
MELDGWVDSQHYYHEAQDKIVGIFPQKSFHHNAYIIGGRKGLEALRDALNKALDGEARHGISTGIAHVTPGDDEVYSLVVMLDHDLSGQEEGNGEADIPLPYYDTRAAEQLRDGAVSLMPPEQHIMEAGIQSYLFNQHLKDLDKQAEEIRAEQAKSTKKKKK